MGKDHQVGRKSHSQPDVLGLGTTALCTPMGQLQSISVAHWCAGQRRSGLEMACKGPGDLHKAKMKMAAPNWCGQKDKCVCVCAPSGCEGR